MKDNSGRIAWLWGPLLLVAVLILAFRLGATGGTGEADSGAGEVRSAASSALPAGPSSGAPVAAPMPQGDMRAPVPGRVFPPVPGYPPAPYAAGPASYPGAGACPPWAMYGWPTSFPRPGDHPGRYWGSGAAEWGPPIGEYGPEAQLDPYWWVAVEEAGE